MSDPCDVVVERVALGEPLGELAEHAASCPRCRRVAALPTELGAARKLGDPGMGFAARMTAGAQHRIVVRRRRRIAAGLAAAVAVTTLGFFAVTRDPDRDQATRPAAIEAPLQPDPWDTRVGDNVPSDEATETDDDLRALVQLADTDRSARLSAKWKDIQSPLAPYRAVLEGVEP